MNATCELVREAASRFRAATGRAPEQVRHVTLAGRLFRLRFAGAALADALMPPLAHLAAPRARPDWTLAVWEDADFSSAVAGLGDSTGRGGAYLREWNSGLALARPHFGEYTVIDAQTRRGFVAFRPGDAPEWAGVTPFRVAVNAALAREGTHLVHAAAVGDRRHAVLLAGRGGSGKSTTAVQCLAEPGLSYFGDDLCLVDVGAEAVTAHSAYNTVKLTAAEARRFPTLDYRHDGEPGGARKLTAYLYPHMRDRLDTWRPVRAVLLPRIGGGPTRVSPAAASEAFRALVAHTLGMVPGNWRRATEAVAALARRVPAYWLDLGDDRGRIAPTVAEFLSMAGRTSCEAVRPRACA